MGGCLIYTVHLLEKVGYIGGVYRKDTGHVLGILRYIGGACRKENVYVLGILWYVFYLWWAQVWKRLNEWLNEWKRLSESHLRKMFRNRIQECPYMQII